MNEGHLDIELLRVFCALMETRSLNRAATRLELSQPAASRALQRLREILGDKLFVKSGLGMAPTPLAVSMAPEIGEALGRLESLVSRERFDPARTRRQFRIATADNGFLTLVGEVLPEFLRLAPHATLEIRQLDDHLFDDLREGRVDAAIFPRPTLPPDYHRRKLLSTDIVCVVRTGHPLALETPEGETPSLAAYGKFRRVSYKVQWGNEWVTDTRRALSEMTGNQPAVFTPYFVGVPLILVKTDLMMMLPRPTAELFAELLPLRILPTPVPFVRFEPELVWHDRVHADPAMCWLRSLFIERFAE